MKSAVAFSRRTLLGVSALALAGCKHVSPPSAPRTDPDATALAAARATEVALIAACEGAGLLEDVAAHRAHLSALGGRAVAPSPSASPLPSEARTLVRSTADPLRNAADIAVDGIHAAILASIAASHAVMAK